MIDSRRVIYLVMIVAVAIPVLLKFSFSPARMVSAERMFKVIQEAEVKPGEVAMVWLDFGPGTIAENQTQAEVIVEHLLRRRIPMILIAQYQQAESFLKSIPRDIALRLEKEYPGEVWRYGEDWINVGYKPVANLFIQSLAATQDVSTLLAKDVNGSALTGFPKFAKIGGIEHIRLVAEVTGLQGVFDNIIQFFQKDGYRPLVVHGCTSITIPEAYIFLDSGQLNGLLEGISGAAWYSSLLKKEFPTRANDTTLVRNTAIGVAQVVILLLIVAGNVVSIVSRLRRKHA